MTTLQQWEEAQANPEVVHNRNFETLSAAGIFAKKQSVTTALTWGYYGGLYNGNTVADGTVTLTDASDNYVVVLRSTGVVSTSTSSTNSTNPLYAKLYKLTCAGGAVTATVDQRVDANGLLFSAGGAKTVLAIAGSDESTAITTGANKTKFINPFSTAFNVTAVVASLSTAQASGGIFTVDVNEAGTTILSTKLTIDNTETNSSTATTPPVISDSSIAAYAEIEIDVDQVGDGTAKGLKVYLIGYAS